jgi:restriction system protein
VCCGKVEKQNEADPYSCGSTLHLVECKKYRPENKVGIGIVQRMLGVVEQHRATQGIIVTTSSFSNDAEVCARSSQYRLGLNEYTDLSKWLAEFAKIPV